MIIGVGINVVGHLEPFMVIGRKDIHEDLAHEKVKLVGDMVDVHTVVVMTVPSEVVDPT